MLTRGERVAVGLQTGNERAEINLSAQIPDTSIDELVKQWARRQVKRSTSSERERLFISPVLIRRV